MSGEIIFKWWRFSIGNVASIGYPNLTFKFHNPKKSYGLFLELCTFKHHLEFRWI